MFLSKLGQLFQKIFELFSRRGSSTGSGSSSSLPGSSPGQSSSANSAGSVLSTSKDGQELIRHYEGLRLTSYKDSVGVWTVGYGDTGPSVVEGVTITKAEADRRLAARLSREFEPGVRAALKQKPTQWQFDAMVSLAYNVGVKNFQGSTLVRKFNAGDAMGAADQFPLWQNAGGRSLKGLRRRRAAERAFFLGEGIAKSLQIGDATQ